MEEFTHYNVIIKYKDGKVEDRIVEAGQLKNFLAMLDETQVEAMQMYSIRLPK